MMVPHVLMIDDSKEDAMLIERVVSRFPGQLQFTWYADPDAALDHLTDTSSPDYLVILLDIKMPRLTGIELLGELNSRNTIRSRSLNIVVFSSSDMQVDIDRATLYPGVSYKTKPSGYLEASAWLNELFTDLLNKSAKLQ